MVRRLINPHLSPELVLSAYHQGLVPMANEVGEIGFYAYEPRGVIPLGPEFTIRRSVRQVLKKPEYTVTFDTVPEQVLHHCSRHGKVPNYELWLSNELIYQYLELFDRGIVHSVEVWKSDEGETEAEMAVAAPSEIEGLGEIIDRAENDRPSEKHGLLENDIPVEDGGLGEQGESPKEKRRLIGGLYGLAFGSVFCGESMFSLEPFGSQIALVHLVQRLRDRGFDLLDAQMPSQHLKQFGLYECSGPDYMRIFHAASKKKVNF